MLHKYSYSDFVRLIFYCQGIIIVGTFRLFYQLTNNMGPILRMSVVYATLGGNWDHAVGHY